MTGTKLLSGHNRKLQKDGIYAFSIPALMSRDGFQTCPGAKECARGCYAGQGFYKKSWVAQAHEVRLAATKQENFTDVMIWEIIARKVKRVRVHDAGDFYSNSYLRKWIDIALACFDTQFYAYTKMLPLFLDIGMVMPNNFTIIYSYGGKWDHRINPDIHKHSKVFRDHATRESHGYIDGTKSDLVVFEHNKIGLVYHGAKNRVWGIDEPA